ncbi:hypothetical protein M436DRAFT_70947 [Aureobasidium namibiae CBS 147.97]|uniref:Uncharacterized protein n=1 Tax=Aureobasidium namibiae CBS 147.97 TaxID=1043004 RepID=A0A074WQN0_9PEZI|nr:uncharacterized protein M436DRAFT_70947 [Aureobasidium namibiae CBS 147.97]KEQ75458.1 hypothetical protein M436DRAFT_70947 [Aureobasidium namibiae CBS 147.97]
MPRRQQVVKIKKKSSNGLRSRDFQRSDASIERTMEQSKSVVEVPFSYPSYTLTSKAALPTCPETCETCVQHYLPESKDWNPEKPRAMVPHSDTEAAQITADYVKSINADRDAIRARLQMDADLVLKRWQRKSVEKRATAVRTAMPEVHARRFQNAWLLYEHKRAFEEYWSTLDKKKINARSDDQGMADIMQALQVHNDSRRKQHLLPFIDVETLSHDPMNLLALLHYRSDSDIADWVMHDFEQLKVGFNWTMGPPSFNPHCVIMYGAHLGRLIPWNKQSAHRHDIIGYPRAVLILEAQAALFAFLRKTVEMLLEPSLHEATAGHQQWDVLVQSDFGKIGPTPLVCRRTEVFRSPPRLDMAAIVEYLHEQRDAMFDELWLLQTDPEYFRDHLIRAKDNEMHDRLATKWREQWVLDYALCYSQACLRPGKSLPTEYEAILVLFQRHLEQLFQEKSFREHYRILEGGVLANPMLWNLTNLYNDNLSQSPTFYLAFIDHLMREDAKNEKSRISPLLATHISNMIVIDDIISSLRYHRPRHGVSVDASKLVKFAESQPRTLPLHEQSAFVGGYGTKEIMWPKLQAFIRLRLPQSDEPAVVLRQLKLLDQTSHDFWDMACVNFMLLIRQSGHPEKLYSDPIYLTQIGWTQAEQKQRALRYVQLQQAADEKKGCKRPRDPPPPPPPPGTSSVITLLQTAWGEPAAPAAAQVPQTKPKVKTRPTAPPISPADDTTWDPKPIVLPPSSATSIQVSSDSLTLLTRMFTADSTTPGEIYWTDFVSAMADAGCSVMPGGGSCFTFTHVDEKEQKHSMVFHRPHPEPSMSKDRLRSFGSRLSRRWGWSEKTFAVKA